MTTAKVLLVDDEPLVLSGYQRNLRRRFEIESTSDPREGVRILADQGPFAVVCSDMRMPEMDGVEFLQNAKRVSPDTVRIMLTGNLDQGTATSAVNDGSVFRFLNKPCSPDALGQAIADALVQYQLIVSEKELLTKTLSASVGLLTEVLSLVNPTAFGRASRIKPLVARLCGQLGVHNSWEITVAAMLSQVGCVTINERTLAKLRSGQTLTTQEEQSWAAHPVLGRQLIAKIPRLERVAEIVGRQNLPFGQPNDSLGEAESTILGGDILKVALDFDELTAGGAKPELAVRCMVDRAAEYNPTVLSGLMAVHSISFATRSVELSQLADGMILQEHITSEFGELLVTQGQEVTPGMRERLRNFSTTAGKIKSPIRVMCP